jgi:uncharacterized protein with HEPN domain
MELESRKYLFDIRRASALIAQFTADRDIEDYTRDPMLRAAVERELEIIGEAMAQLSRVDQSLAARISERRRIIAFRNILIHAYAEIDDRLVWDVVQTKLPVLRREIDALLSDA